MDAPFLDRFAYIISAMFSPFVVVVIFPLVVLGSSLTHDSFFTFSILWITFAAVVPFLYVYWGVKTGRFSDMHIMIRQERVEPFLVANASALVLIVISLYSKAPVQLTALAVSLLANGLLFSLISLRWKISVHAAAYTGAVVTVAVLIDPTLWWLIIFLPIIVWARVRRHRHSVLQSLVAAAIVTVVTYLILVWFGLAH